MKNDWWFIQNRSVYNIVKMSMLFLVGSLSLRVQNVAPAWVWLVVWALAGPGCPSQGGSGRKLHVKRKELWTKSTMHKTPTPCYLSITEGTNLMERRNSCLSVLFDILALRVLTLFFVSGSGFWSLIRQAFIWLYWLILALYNPQYHYQTSN